MKDRADGFFGWLFDKKLPDTIRVASTDDGFEMAVVSLSDILACHGVTTFPGSRGQTLECRNFFDDWYLYAVPGEKGPVYSLIKMREQEYDKAQGLEADGDTPGVTVCFIAFDTDVLCRCIDDSSDANRSKLADEINRVVAWRGQRHNEALKAYFIRPEAQAPYIIAPLYARYIASHAADGRIAVPEHYSMICAAGKNRRIPEFIAANNRAAGYTVCDDRHIFIKNADSLTEHETLAILATHTGNTSFHSFAAEVRYHARFLVPAARLPLPVVGSVYASAIRADMSIQDREFQGPKPYYRPGSRLMRQQEACHRDNR